MTSYTLFVVFSRNYKGLTAIKADTYFPSFKTAGKKEFREHGFLLVTKAIFSAEAEKIGDEDEWNPTKILKCQPEDFFSRR